MKNLIDTFLKDSDLIRACLCGVLAALVMSYVNRITAPVYGHVLLALVALCATMAAFLSIAPLPGGAGGQSACRYWRWRDLYRLPCALILAHCCVLALIWVARHIR
jgi:hypothetical protein